MADQILSQEEIDALLNAMSTGEVDLKPEKGTAADAKPHDLAAQGAVLRGEFHALEEIYQRFATATTEALAPYVSSGIEATFVSTERVRFGDFLKSCADPTSFSLVSMAPLSGFALLTMEPHLAFSLMDCAFGGPGTPMVKVRPFTLIEQRIINKFVTIILGSLQSSWVPIYPVEIAVASSETNPNFLRFVEPKDFVVHSLFSLKGKAFSGNLYLSISYLMLEPIRDHLSPSFLARPKTAGEQSPEIKRLLGAAGVNLTVELGRGRLTVRDMLQLKLNDTISLDRGPQDAVTILVEGTPKFAGSPGVVKGSRAVQITRLLIRNGGNISSGNE